MSQLGALKATWIGAAREGDRLADRWGGRAADYAKVTSSERTILSDGSKLDQIHAYLNIKTTEVVEPKSALTQEPIHLDSGFYGLVDPRAGFTGTNEFKPH